MQPRTKGSDILSLHLVANDQNFPTEFLFTPQRQHAVTYTSDTIHMRSMQSNQKGSDLSLLHLEGDIPILPDGISLRIARQSSSNLHVRHTLRKAHTSLPERDESYLSPPRNSRPDTSLRISEHAATQFQSKWHRTHILRLVHRLVSERDESLFGTQRNAASNLPGSFSLPSRQHFAQCPHRWTCLRCCNKQPCSRAHVVHTRMTRVHFPSSLHCATAVCVHLPSHSHHVANSRA